MSDDHRNPLAGDSSQEPKDFRELIDLGRATIREAFEKLHRQHDYDALTIIACALNEVAAGAEQLGEKNLASLLYAAELYVVRRLCGDSEADARNAMSKALGVLLEPNAPGSDSTQ